MLQNKIANTFSQYVARPISLVLDNNVPSSSSFDDYPAGV